MNPALLRQRISIQRGKKNFDEYSQEVIVWETINTVSAQVIAKSVREFINGGLTSSVEYEITVRAPLDVQASDRISFDGKLYAINGVMDKLGTKRYLTIKATEGQAT